MQFIQVENLSLRYGNQDILNNINFFVTKGKIVGLLGPNGAGKSSVIKILAGLVFPDKGKLYIKNIPQPTFSELRQYCGYLIETPSFYPYLSANKNLTLIKRISKSTIDIDALLDKVGLAQVNRKKVKFFSTGMKQRLAIAQALLRNPEMLILDEPFNGLDPNGFLELKNLLKELSKKGTTIFVSSHLLNELEQFADTFILLHQGKIAFNITKEDLIKSKKKIIFTFEESFSEETKLYLLNINGIFESDFKVILHLCPNEIAKTINKLVTLKSTPINVETHTILQEKYFEITV